MASFHNPPLDPAQMASSVPQAPHPELLENPPWNGWDVLRLAGLTVFSIMSCLFIVIYAAHQFLYRNVPLVEVAKYPTLGVVGQLVAYLLVLVFMYFTASKPGGEGFWQALRWNWPSNWGMYLAIGVMLSIGLQAFANLLPMPKHLPIDRFFQTTSEAYLLAVFGMTFAPLLEELFFRGFLYPVLARRMGVGAAVGLTALSFGLIHAPQLGRAWGPVLVIFLVGIALTATRAVTKSLAASLLIHGAYNATISVLIFFATDHFRHLEKLTR